MSEARDEVARVVEQVAREGLPHPRNLDAALDAIFESINNEQLRHFKDIKSALIDLLGALDDEDNERVAWAMQEALNSLGDTE
jgi:hypothetical protein